MHSVCVEYSVFTIEFIFLIPYIIVNLNTIQENNETLLGAGKDAGLEVFSWLRTGSGAGFCEHGNGPSCSIKKAGCCLTS
jgi:hypothetical protein